MDKLHIVKIGGKVIENKDSLISFLEDFASLEESKILIHGGGNEANNISKKIGLEIKIEGGRRITDSDSLDIITMIYAGKIIKKSFHFFNQFLATLWEFLAQTEMLTLR